MVSEVSIHAPAKGATTSDLSTCRPSYVSIHAPAKGATNEANELLEIEWVSIHAPAKGATRVWLIWGESANGFQFTLPRRERPSVDRLRRTTATFQFTLPRRERPLRAQPLIPLEA